MNFSDHQRLRLGDNRVLVVAAHVVLTAVVCALAITFKGPGPSLVRIFLHCILQAQACLLAIWFTLSPANIWLRFAGILVGMGGLLLASLAGTSFSLPEDIGLGIEMLVVPALGVAVVMRMLPLMTLKTGSEDSDTSETKLRVSLLGLLAIVIAV